MKPNTQAPYEIEMNLAGEGIGICLEAGDEYQLQWPKDEDHGPLWSCSARFAKLYISRSNTETPHPEEPSELEQRLSPRTLIPDGQHFIELEGIPTRGPHYQPVHDENNPSAQLYANQFCNMRFYTPEEAYEMLTPQEEHPL